MEPLAGFLAPAVAQVRPELTGKAVAAPSVPAGLFQGILTDLLLLGATGESPPTEGEMLPTEPQPGAKAPGLALLLNGSVPPPALPAPAPAPEEAAEPTPAEGMDAVAAENLAALTAAVLTQTQAPAPAPAPAAAQPAPVPDQARTASAAAPVEMVLSDPATARFVAQAVQSLTASKAAPASTGQTDGEAPRFEDLVHLMAEAEGDAPVSAKPSQQAAPASPVASAKHAAVPARHATAPVSHQVPDAALVRPEAPARAEASRPFTVVEAPELVRPDSVPAPDPASEIAVPDQPLPQPLAAAGPAELRSDLPVGMEPAEPGRQVEPEMVTRQVTRFVKVMLDGETAEARLMLHPKHLGAVAVKLVINEGAVRANLTVSDQAVKAALDASLETLRNRFAEQGFRVEHVQVSVGSDSQLGGQQPRQQQQHEQHQGHRPGRPAFLTDSGTTPETEAPPQTRLWTPGFTGRRLNSLA